MSSTTGTRLPGPAALILVLAALGGSATPALAQETPPVPEAVVEFIAGDPPSDGCYGGALSEEPLVCYALERSSADGAPTVEGVYHASP